MSGYLRRVVKLIVLYVMLGMYHLFAQGTITVSNSRPIEQVVEDLAGSGAKIFNVTTNCNLTEPSAGEFVNTGPMAIPRGLVMTTGSIWDIPNNNSGSTSFPARGPSYDPDLNAIDSNTYDVCVIEFDFVVSRDTLEFYYVFGSEEYEEYVGSEFNDIFGFFLSGPGISGTVNLAVVPGTNMPVTINNINHVTNSAYYISNTLGQYPYIEYDGFTVRLPAKHPIIPCDTYHIKLAIADIGDEAYDAGVFIEEGSFGGGVPYIEFIPLDGNTTNVVTEGCVQGAIVIYVDPVPDTPIVVRLSYGGNATNGVDLDTLPDSVVLTPDNPADTFYIIPFWDSQTEEAETLIIYREGVCNELDKQEIIIIDPVYARIIPPDTTVCEGDTLYINVETNSPIVRWMPSIVDCDTCHNTFIVVDTPVQVVVIAGTGSCRDTDTVVVLTEPPPFVESYPKIIEMCTPDSVTIQATGFGTAFLWYKDYDTTVIDTGLKNTFFVTDTTVFTISAQPIRVCPPDTTNVIVYAHPIPEVSAIGDTIIFLGTSAIIDGTVTNSVTHWWEPAELVPNPYQIRNEIKPFDTVMLVLTGVNRLGCSSSDTMWVYVIKRPPCDKSSIFAPLAFTPNGDGLNDVFYIYSHSQEVEVKTFRIYDKWGELVFEASDVRFDPATGQSNIGWDGTYKGSLMRPDVYVYYVEYICRDSGMRLLKKGDVTLIR